MSKILLHFLSFLRKNSLFVGKIGGYNCNKEVVIKYRDTEIVHQKDYELCFSYASVCTHSIFLLICISHLHWFLLVKTERIIH